jgi:hypothetical protein
MGLKLDAVVPWGRSLHEYTQMFALTPEDLQRNILDCAGGPASFNAEMTQQGHPVISCDPIYQFSAAEIERRIQETYPVILEGVTANQDKYVWTRIRSPQEMGEVRLKSMQRFLQDFPVGLSAGRYVVAELPRLPFGDRQFDLALCSHLLFTYSDQLNLQFHLAAVQELCRVAAEVRIFPIIKVDGDASPWLQPIIDERQAAGCAVHVQTVDYEFQKGGDRLLKISSG